MRVGAWSGAVVLVAVLLAWIGSYLLPYDLVTDVDPARAGLGPAAAHWLGTDHLGRDVAWRLLVGSRAFVGPGLLACLVASVLGVLAGAVAGYFGGWLAAALRFGSTVTASLPRFILVLLVISIYGNSIWLIGATAGLAYAPTVAEAVYGRIDSLRGEDFVLAARAHGLGRGRILFYHLLWVNCRDMVGRHALSLFGYLLLLETTLSYIGGFGVMEPEPSWGNMLAFEFGHHTDNPWGLWAPALAIWITILACNLLGEALAEKRHG